MGLVARTSGYRVEGKRGESLEEALKSIVVGKSSLSQHEALQGSGGRSVRIKLVLLAVLADRLLEESAFFSCTRDTDILPTSRAFGHMSTAVDFATDRAFEHTVITNGY